MRFARNWNLITIAVLMATSIVLSGCLFSGDDQAEDDEGDWIGPDHIDSGGIGFTIPPGEYIFASEVEYDNFFDSDTGDIDPAWFDLAAARGLSILSFELMTLDATMLIDSPTLASAGFHFDDDHGAALPAILEQAARHNMTVVLMIEGLAHIQVEMFPFDPDIKPEMINVAFIQELIREIAAAGREAGVQVGITEEVFSEGYVNGMRATTKEEGILYVRFFDDLRCRPDIMISEDFSYYPRDIRGSAADMQYMIDMNTIGSYYGKLGYLNMMFGVAKGCDKIAAVGAAGGWGAEPKSHQNIALMRAVQFGPQIYMFIVAEGEEGPYTREEADFVESYDYTATLVPLLDEFIRQESDTAKPVANLILDPEWDDETDLAEFWTNGLLGSLDAVTNAILAAGFDLIVTMEPVVDAELYYVLASGYVWGQGHDLSTAVADLIDGDAPVWFQTTAEVGHGPNWERVLADLGISDPAIITNEDPDHPFEPFPDTVTWDFPTGTETLTYGGISFEPWTADQIGSFPYGHFIHVLPSTEMSSEVLLSGTIAADSDEVKDDESALIIRNGNSHFINGGQIHFETTYILANLFAEEAGSEPVYNAPSYGYLTAGADRSVIMGIYDGPIDVNLPGGTRVTEFDEDGNRLASSGLTLDGNRLHGELDHWHLVIVDTP